MYEYESRIGFSQCDQYKRLTISGIVDAFQDSSTFQSEDLGRGVDYLATLGCAWVLNYWEIDIIKRPVLGDRVWVGTMPHSLKGFLGGRNFCIKDMNGEYMVKANSLWTFLDMKAAKPVRIPDDIVGVYEIGEKLDMNYGDRKVAIPEGDDFEIIKADEIVIQKHHLDSNRHVNNGQFVKIVLSYVEDVYDVSACSRFRIDYRKQAMLGDKIIPYVYSMENKAVVVLKDENEAIYSVAELS